jgi:hypothetical protein
MEDPSVSIHDPPVRDLLAAIHDALDVPRTGDLRADNASTVIAALAVVLDDRHELVGLPWATDWIREHTTKEQSA